jgi:hypothetical protein
LIRVFNQRREQIALHALAEPGKFTTDPLHLHSAKGANLRFRSFLIFVRHKIACAVHYNCATLLFMAAAATFATLGENEKGKKAN